jgi:solute carrier family 13 (sodium-dependent dicarboxylate transporter), member 2/3/5
MLNKALLWRILGPLLAILLYGVFLNLGIAKNVSSVLALSVWMIYWWLSETVPFAITSLLPLIVLPMAQVFTLQEAATSYGSPIVFLFLGGFFMALLLEKHNLHTRITLQILKFTGHQPGRIILGFSIATAFLSMWISNTATAMMMLPIATGVIQMLSDEHLSKKEISNFTISLYLSIAYAASIGGIATPIGTPPNVVLIGLIEQRYNFRPDFLFWMITAIPIVVVVMGAMHLLLTKILFPCKHIPAIHFQLLIKEKQRAIGVVSANQQWVLLVFTLACIGWVFQDLINQSLGIKALNDTNVALIAGTLAFVLPNIDGAKGTLLHWKDTVSLPWSILLFFGGGLCLASALEKVGIIQYIGTCVSQQFEYGWLFMLLIILLTVLLSELMSNVALVQIFVPVALGMADGFHISPLFIALPMTFAASMGFMFPMATPPNAMIFATGKLKMMDMVKAGIGLDLISIIVILLASHFWLPIAIRLLQ